MLSIMLSCNISTFQLYMSHSLNSFKRGYVSYIGDYLGDYYRGY